MTKLDKTRQNKTKQDKTKQNKTKQDKTRQNKTKYKTKDTKNKEQVRVSGGEHLREAPPKKCPRYTNRSASKETSYTIFLFLNPKTLINAPF